MQTLLIENNTHTMSVREVIRWASSSGREIFVHEFNELKAGIQIYDDMILLTCIDGTIQFDLHNYFVDVLSLVVHK